MKDKITYLDLVIPVCVLYLTGLCLWSYFVNGRYYSYPIFDVFLVLILTSFLGVSIISLLRDIDSLIGFKNITKYIEDEINKELR